MEKIKYTVEDNVGIIIYDNPPLNIMEMGDLKDISETFRKADEDKEVSVILFTMAMQKEGKIYSAGMNLDQMLADGETEEGIREYCRESKSYFRVQDEIATPVVYAFDGSSLGGSFEASLFADFRIAGENIKVGLPELNLGIIPGGGGTYNLSRLVGEAKAKEIVFTSKTIRSEELKAWGLVNEVHPSEELYEKSLEFAKKLAERSPQALQAAKKAFNDGRFLQMDEGLEHETTVFTENFQTYDAREGIKAFKEKREPKFENR